MLTVVAVGAVLTVVVEVDVVLIVVAGATVDTIVVVEDVVLIVVAGAAVDTIVVVAAATGTVVGMDVGMTATMVGSHGGWAPVLVCTTILTIMAEWDDGTLAVVVGTGLVGAARTGAADATSMVA